MNAGHNAESATTNRTKSGDATREEFSGSRLKDLGRLSQQVKGNHIAM